MELRLIRLKGQQGTKGTKTKTAAMPCGPFLFLKGLLDARDLKRRKDLSAGEPLRVEAPVPDRETEERRWWMATACSKGLAGLLLCQVQYTMTKSQDEWIEVTGLGERCKRHDSPAAGAYPQASIKWAAAGPRFGVLCDPSGNRCLYNT